MGFVTHQGTKYYYSFDRKVTLNESNNKLVVRYKQTKNSDKQKVSLYSELSNKSFEWNDDSTCIISVDPKEKDNLLIRILNQPDVKTCNPVYTLDTGFEMAVTDEFVVKFIKDANQTEIEKFIDQHKLQLLNHQNLSYYLKHLIRLMPWKLQIDFRKQV
jgi:hypothetical protein